jgi:hypothetical protein
MAQKVLNGWSPQTQLESGLKKAIAYFEKVLSRGVAAEAV